jgi:hypothetical protein
MTDAVVLLALSQLVCLGGLGYLFMQHQRTRTGAPRSRRGGPAPAPRTAPASTARAARQAYERPTRPQGSPAARLAEELRAQGGLDIASLARRMNRSEEEVRLLLRRQGVAR